MVDFIIINDLTKFNNLMANILIVYSVWTLMPIYITSVNEFNKLAYTNLLDIFIVPLLI